MEFSSLIFRFLRIFWINPPIVLVSAALFIVAWPRHGKLKQHADPKSIRKFDVLGCFLLIVGCVLPTFAFQHQGQSGASWDDPLFIGSLVGGTVSWVLLILWQVRAAAHPGFINPVLPLHLLRHRRLAATAINSLFMGMLFNNSRGLFPLTVWVGFGLFTVVYDVPLRLQIVNGKSPLQGGLGLLTMLCCAAVASFLGPGFSRKRDLLCHTLIIGSVLMALGLGLLSTLSEGPEVQSKLYGFQTLVGLGFGLLVSVAGIIVNIECRTTDHAIGQGLVAQARVLGGSLGLAASTAIVGEKRNLFAGSLDAWRPTPEALAFRESMWLAAAMLCGAFLAACFTWSNSKTPIAVRLAHNEDDEEEQNK